MSSTAQAPERPGFFKLWFMAARPKTLTATLAPISVGTSLAVLHDAFAPLAMVMALLGALCIQIGTNYANDLFDAKKGTDDEERLGPQRVTATGMVSEREITLATAAAFTAAFVCGLYLVYVAGWPLLVLGLVSIALGVAYTGGPFPLAYNALGDVFVFVCFGLVATAGTYYVQALELHPVAIALGVPVGALGTALLIVNNLRDIEGDKKHRKVTTAVLLGPARTRAFYLAMLLVAYASPLALAARGHIPWTALLALGSLPLAALAARRLYRSTGVELNKVLALTAMLQLVTSILLAVGVAL